MSALDDLALSDDKLEAWLARKRGQAPLVRSISALEGFVTAVAAGPSFADPQLWICPCLGMRWDVMRRGSHRDHAVIASVARIYNRVVDLLGNAPQAFAPRFATKADGNVDPRPWCQGFYAAMQLNLDGWQPLLDINNPQHGLLLPILAYCVDDAGRPVLGAPRPGAETEHFFEYEGHKDIAPVVVALRDLHRITRYDSPR